MPQMAPLSWTVLYIMFSLTFTLFLVMNFYQTLVSTQPMNKTDKKLMLINWKW
uniref:ATP synthase F0 subunit 8 n=1 Tax=Coraebus diminutus TaxID=1857261 RepID=UPI00207AF84B|nr:ATP synthase F0 subunit 8 [Coraebus diminutus]URN73079.1 ATP synthase F0 subunit 8 [Coraebus diminutus]